MIENRHFALIALGSNENSVFGDPKETVLKAMEIVAKMSVAPPILSELYSTPAFPAGAGPDFVNAAVVIKTAATPDQLLSQLHDVERMAKRTRNVRWGQRTLDLDLIGVGDAVLPDPQVHAHWRDLSASEQQTDTPDQLILPHPRVQDRAFVLVPLCDVAPDWVHPILLRTAVQMRDALPANDLANITRCEGAE
jgi:2-amino-4-hydroxy-6-hydroxymethyldihydropteridine diphosphokinase